MAEALLNGGIDLLQLRAKNLPEREIEKLGREVHTITAQHGVPLSALYAPMNEPTCASFTDASNAGRYVSYKSRSEGLASK
mgnify:CR=1 FL=1